MKVNDKRRRRRGSGFTAQVAEERETYSRVMVVRVYDEMQHAYGLWLFQLLRVVYCSCDEDQILGNGNHDS